MSGIRDLLGGSGGEVIPPPPPIVFGGPIYSTDGKMMGTEVLSGHPLRGDWISVAFSNQIKLSDRATQEGTPSAVVADSGYPMHGYAKSITSAQNAAILWGTVDDAGVSNFDGMSPDFFNPSCLLPAAASVPYGGRLLYVSDGLWNFTPSDGMGNYVGYAYPLVWDGSNNLTAVLLINNTDQYSNVEYNTFVRCTLDVAKIETWLNQFVCGA
jgi:hypothetical protein